MSKLTLLLDMDGIIADFNRHSVVMYNWINGTHYDPDLCNQYIGDHEVLEPTMDPKRMRFPYKQPGFFINLPVISGSQKAISKLEELFDIYVLTTHYWGNPTCVAEKEAWLMRFFPSIADKGIFTKHKHMIPGDILVDDRPINCKNWLASNPNGKTASLKLPWSDTEHQHILAETWDDLASKIIEKHS